MKQLILGLIFSVILALIPGCQNGQGNQKNKQLPAGAKSQFGKMIEKSKEVSEKVSERAEEELQAAEEAYEDTKVEVEKGLAEVKKEVEDVIDP